ncbi:MAG: hypothetical protein Q8859_10710 [Bacteroidota bacterium]|nr:hypothetical protein [Bacteroidota bacterium]
MQREVELSHEIDSHPNVANFKNCYRFTTMRLTVDYAVMDYYPEGNLNDVLKKHLLTDSEKRVLIAGNCSDSRT